MRALIEAIQSPLPRKFWLNPATGTLLACKDHVSAVLDNSLGLPAAKIAEWRQHLAQWAHDEEEYRDALDENQSDLLELAMNAGWVRGGADYPPVYVQALDQRLVRHAARYLRDRCGQDRINVEIGNGGVGGLLGGDDLKRFIATGRLPR